jgi:hypothetical protein
MDDSQRSGATKSLQLLLIACNDGSLYMAPVTFTYEGTEGTGELKFVDGEMTEVCSCYSFSSSFFLLHIVIY